MTQTDAECPETQIAFSFQSMAGKLTKLARHSPRNRTHAVSRARLPQKLADFPMDSTCIGSEIGSLDCLTVGESMCYLINFETVFSENKKVKAIFLRIFYLLASS